MVAQSNVPEGLKIKLEMSRNQFLVLEKIWRLRKLGSALLNTLFLNTESAATPKITVSCDSSYVKRGAWWRIGGPETALEGSTFTTLT